MKTIWNSLGNIGGLNRNLKVVGVLVVVVVLAAAAAAAAAAGCCCCCSHPLQWYVKSVTPKTYAQLSSYVIGLLFCEVRCCCMVMCRFTSGHMMFFGRELLSWYVICEVCYNRDCEDISIFLTFVIAKRTFTFSNYRYIHLCIVFVYWLSFKSANKSNLWHSRLLVIDAGTGILPCVRNLKNM